MNTPGPADELVFLPLGGSGEIGMNFNAYGYGPENDRQWIIVVLQSLLGKLRTNRLVIRNICLGLSNRHGYTLPATLSALITCTWSAHILAIFVRFRTPIQRFNPETAKMSGYRASKYQSFAK
mgnify:CR=1 FL=1